MERDFMGLANQKDLNSEEHVDAEPVRSVAMQWSFSNKNPPNTLHHHQIIIPNPPQTGFDSLASTGLVSITTFDAYRKPYANNLVQGGRKKSAVVIPEKEAVGGVCYSVHQPLTTTRENMTVLPSSMSTNNKMINPFAENRIGSINATVNNPISNHHVPVVGTTDLRNSPKISSAPAQLTIFYNGSVCVYDDISPEKAQAIMLLAGNGPQAATSSSAVEASVPKASVIEGLVLSQHHEVNTTNSISVSKLSGNNNDTTAVKLGGKLATTSDSVPQFRVKSLARFLEKRKQRVISSAPYATKQSAADTPSSSGSFSIQLIE